MVLTDAALLKGRDVVAECRQAARGGATMIQVRLKDAPPRDVAALTRSLVGALAIPVIVNDRVDVALAAGAAGAHLGQDDLPLDRVRPHVPPPPTFLLGISVGTPAEAERVRAWDGGADYWSVGPCFATGNKPDAGPPLGVEGFARLARLAPAGTRRGDTCCTTNGRRDSSPTRASTAAHRRSSRSDRPRAACPA